MAFEPNYEKVVSSFRKNLGVTQSMVECKLPTDEGISKILCASAKGYISSSEVDGRNINYMGAVSFQVTYLNSENEIVGVDYTVEFKDKFTATDDISGVPAPTCTVVDVNSVVNGGELKVVAMLEIGNDIIVNNAQVVLVGTNDLLTKREALSFNTYCGKIDERFEVVQDYEIKDGVSKVLTVCTCPYISSVTPHNKFITVTGGVNVDISYLTDENMLRTAQTTFDFAQEISSDCVDEMSVLQSDLYVVSNDVKVTTSVNVDSAVVNLNIPLNYVGYVFNTNTIDVVADAFSLTNFVNITSESITTFQGYESAHYEERVSGNLTIDDDLPAIDEVLGTCCNHIALASAVVENNLFTVEGVAYTTILYQNKELNNINSVQIEMPFSLSNNVEFNAQNVIPLVQLSLGEINARVRRNKELEVNADLHIFAEFYTTQQEGVISKITLDDEIPFDECALSIYITKEGDSVWDIAKELGVSPETIMEQNPTLTEEIAPLTRVVVYKQKVQEF